MFDVKELEELRHLDDILGKAINDEKQTVISLDLMRRISFLWEVKRANLRKAERLIAERYEPMFGWSDIVMPLPVTPAPQVAEVAEIQSYTRRIPLPPPTEPYYRGVLSVEAEALLEDWLNISLGNKKVLQ